MPPPLQEAADGFADQPENRLGSGKEAQLADTVRWRHYNRVGQAPTTQVYRDSVQDTVLRNMMNGHRKLKVTTTDENGMNTTVFFDEAASLALIDSMAETMKIRETRSRKGFRASLNENTLTAVEFGDESSCEGPTENNR